jgi:hypothetical protein
LIIAGTIAAVVFIMQRDHPAKQSSNKDTGQSKVDYGPATEDQKHPAGVDIDKNGPPPDQGSQAQPGQKRTVSVVITTWAQKHGDLTVNGYVDNVVEDGGTCTLTLSKDNITKSASRPAQPNATNTTCGENDIPLTSLSPGTWQATLSYSSDLSNGVSKSVPVEVTNE